jgi:hypothetical protein
MDFVKVPIPQIAIIPAPQQEPVEEPLSPFSWASVSASGSDDSFRQQHLTPPPVASPRLMRQLSPLRPSDAPVTGKGLERERFELLLRASRERNIAVGGRKAGDLRKEIALKAHKNKQLERRALFLSKVQAPPSPGATLLPKTPPESPAVFHYTLPSPGLVSPLALFESLANDDPARISYQSRESWVEQVDFRIPGDDMKSKEAPRSNLTPSRRGIPSKRLPSLDQITARLSFQGQVFSPVPQTTRSTRLPAFLKAERTPAKQESSPPKEVSVSPATRPTLAAVGRLQMPTRAVVPISAPVPTKAETSQIIPPKSPCSPAMPNLEVTVTLVPRTASASPSKLSESNLLAFDSRTTRAKDMLSTIKRRMLPSELGMTGRDPQPPQEEDRRLKRRSAPAELQTRLRCGFQHPVLSLPGGF